MTEHFYEQITSPFRNNPQATSALFWTNKALTYVGYVSYPLLLLLVALAGDWLALAKSVLVPASGFLLVTVFRSWLNAPRPYEVLAISPLIQKDTRGHSFPSRHAFSMMMIACTWLAWYFPAGCALLVAACVLAAIRVIGGVHFPRDVVAGALFAIAWSVLGYCVLPW